MSSLKLMEALKRPAGEGLIPTGIGVLDARLGGGIPRHDLTMIAGLGPHKDNLVESMAISLAKAGVRVIYAGLKANSKVNATLSLISRGEELGLSFQEVSALPIELLDCEWDCVTFSLLNDVLISQIGDDEGDVVLVIDSATMLEGAHSIAETVTALKGIAYEFATLVAAANTPCSKYWMLDDSGAVLRIESQSGDGEVGIIVEKAARIFSPEAMRRGRA